MSSNQYEAETETRERAHTSAVRELAQSRTQLKVALTAAEASGVPPFQSVIDPEPPVAPAHRRGVPRWSGSLQGAHAAALEYWTDVRPYRDNAAKKWEEPVIEVGFPVQGGWETVSRDYEPDIRRRGVKRVREAVTLADLGWWRFQEVELISKQEGSGSLFDDSAERHRREKVHLPIVACQAVYEQLDDVLEKIGLLAEVRENSAGDSDPGDGDAWGQYDE